MSGSDATISYAGQWELNFKLNYQVNIFVLLAGKNRLITISDFPEVSTRTFILVILFCPGEKRE